MLRRYRAPDGRHFGGLVEVMRNLAHSQDTAEQEAGLEQEGWAPLAGLRSWWHRADRCPGQGTFLAPPAGDLHRPGSDRGAPPGRRRLQAGGAGAQGPPGRGAAGCRGEDSSDDQWEEAGLLPGWRVSWTGSSFLAPGGRVLGSRAQAI